MEAAIELVEPITSRSKLRSYKPIVPSTMSGSLVSRNRFDCTRDVEGLRCMRFIAKIRFTTPEIHSDRCCDGTCRTAGFRVRRRAGIEALLTGPGDEDRVSAADRMASLVACSFPRAELARGAYFELLSQVIPA